MDYFFCGGAHLTESILPILQSPSLNVVDGTDRLVADTCAQLMSVRLLFDFFGTLYKYFLRIVRPDDSYELRPLQVERCSKQIR
jgi:hypothetical protein